MSALSTVGDVFSDPEFSAPGNRFCGDLDLIMPKMVHKQWTKIEVSTSSGFFEPQFVSVSPVVAGVRARGHELQVSVGPKAEVPKPVLPQ